MVNRALLTAGLAMLAAVRRVLTGVRPWALPAARPARYSPPDLSNNDFDDSNREARHQEDQDESWPRVHGFSPLVPTSLPKTQAF